VNRRTVGSSIAGIISASVFALAFGVASRACEGGLELYFWSGVAALAILVTLPFLMHFGDFSVRLAGHLACCSLGLACG
jgi:hypothetical protein